MRDIVRFFDKFTFALLLLLALAGILLIYSAGHSTQETNYLKQAAWLAVSLAGFLAVFSMKLDFIFRKSFSVYVLLLVILALQLVVGHTVARTKSWFRLWGIGFQFSEFVKVPLALFLARLLARHKEIDGWAFMKVMAVILAPVALIVLQPDMGVSFILCSFIPLVILLKKVRPALLVIAFLLFALGGFAAWHSLLKPYQKERIISFLNPAQYKDSTGYHIIQSRIAIGSGGLSGKGYRKGSQSRYQFLPARHTDFIISVVGEELGFVAIGTLFFVFFLVFYRQLRFNFENDEEFYYVYLFNGLIFFQFLVNVAMAIGFFPVLGVSLPFVSYGGSSLLSFFIGEAIIFRVKISNYLA
ncbi:MAG: FtsW/RodA/SpoVE family cell cycle protein [Acidobacteria bacterium]|jgi:rod shape determining protein RodA|nr:FtsW/RodA/SpoVE family cell cycle protein [Acidobacteriota bacterium]